MTRREKNIIRAHYADCYHALRFRADGSVEAQQAPGAPWGLLYSADDAQRHLDTVAQYEADRAKGRICVPSNY